MDSSALTTLISSVGFPIVMCGAMAWYINTTVKEMTTIIANNTLALEKLMLKISDIESLDK